MLGGPEAARVKLFVGTSLFNLFLALVSLAVILWISRAEKGLAAKIAAFKEKRAQDCANLRVVKVPTPMVFDPDRKAPPQDVPKNGYFGPKGAEITPTMRLMVEAARPGAASNTTNVRLGSQQVLPSQTIHVVNLWATWCEACRDEMPDFQALFARRADWEQDVRFVPIMVEDENDPVRAYRDLVREMPPAPWMLADRSADRSFTKILRTDPKLQLYRGDLPVTLVLDCNRRVRWAQFAQLSRQSFIELEGYVDRLRSELADESPDAWCKQEWPGNGRCEGLENTQANHSLEDCGELKRPSETVEAPPEPPPPALEECPEGMIRKADGQCGRKLRGDASKVNSQPKVDSASTCGNGVCDPKENSDICCQDCACTEPLVCRPAREGAHKCQLRGLKGSSAGGIQGGNP